MSNAHLCGYRYDPVEIAKAVASRGLLMQAAPNIKGAGKGKTVFLWKLQEKYNNGQLWPPHNQTIGDCVSHGVTGASETLQWVMKALNDKNIEPKQLATEFTYGTSRVEVGGGRIPANEDGSVVAWGIQASQQYGYLARDKYGDIDLSTYSGQRAKQWGANPGPPKALFEYAKEHILKDAKALEGPDFYSEAIDAIASGGVIVSGSNWIFNDTRDKYGFCKHQQSGGHCVHFVGFSDNPARPGIVYKQSWGPNMPTQGSQEIILGNGAKVIMPEACFFITPQDFNKMHSSEAELWAISGMDDWSTIDEKIAFYFYTDDSEILDA